MEAVKFTTCDKCKDTNVKCDFCFGHSHFYFSDNNFIYWNKEISYLSIFIREFRRVIDIIINFILISSLILTIVLVYKILNTAQFDPRSTWELLISVNNKDNLYLSFLMILDMYLYYRITIPVIKEKRKFKLLGDKETFLKYNIADNLSPEADNILDKAWLYTRYKKVFPVSVWHLLFILLNDKDIRLVLARLGIGADNLKKQIDDNLDSLVSKEEQTQGLSFILKESFLNSYIHMRDRQVKRIADVDLLAGIVLASQEIKNFFYDFNIDENKIDNVIHWVRVNKELIERYNRFRGKSLLKPKSGINRAYTAIATPVLDSFSQDLTLASKSGSLSLSVAREKEITEILNTVESDYSSIVLVGPSGVGKTNIVEGIANRMMAEEIPELFQDKRLVSISVPLLISGATGTGRLEQRFISLLNEVAVSGNIILVIENIHQLAGVSSEGTEGLDLSEVLSSEIRKRNVMVIGTTDNKNYIQYLEGKTLGQALKKVNIIEPDKNQTIKIMEAHVGFVEGRHKVYFTYDALEKIYDLSNRYLSDQSLPRKAIDLMDEAGIWVAKAKNQDNLVRPKDITALVSNKTNIPLTEVTEQESSKLLNLEEEIHERIVGQEEAVKLVSSALRRARSELRDLKRPITNLLFLGPTGVGKTELAKTVAEKYFSSEENMIRLDMSEYQNKTSLPRLIGSPQTGTAGLLTEAVRHKPFALLLLDEIEKAHPDILNIFLQVMEDGRLTDALGRTVDFTNLIIVATSNAGTSFIQDQVKKGIPIDDFKDQFVKEEIRDIFAPEFINRFDGVVIFKPLTAEEIFKIAGFMLNKVKKRLETKGIFFEITPEAVKELAKAGFDPVFGARPLRRVIQERVDNALADFLLTGKIGRRDTVVYDIGGKISVKKPEGY